MCCFWTKARPAHMQAVLASFSRLCKAATSLIPVATYGFSFRGMGRSAIGQSEFFLLLLLLLALVKGCLFDLILLQLLTFRFFVILLATGLRQWIEQESDLMADTVVFQSQLHWLAVVRLHCNAAPSAFTDQLPHFLIIGLRVSARISVAHRSVGFF